MLYKLLAIAISIFIIWQLFAFFRTHPESFSKANINRSIFTLGVLTLLLIGFIAILVLIVRH